MEFRKTTLRVFLAVFFAFGVMHSLAKAETDQKTPTFPTLQNLSDTQSLIMYYVICSSPSCFVRSVEFKNGHAWLIPNEHALNAKIIDKIETYFGNRKMNILWSDGSTHRQITLTQEELNGLDSYFTSFRKDICKGPYLGFALKQGVQILETKDLQIYPCMSGSQISAESLMRYLSEFDDEPVWRLTDEERNELFPVSIDKLKQKIANSTP